MASEKRVAVVTGSNKGIGYEIVRALCKQFNGDVILTARNEELGLKAVKTLKAEGLNPVFHRLDICDKTTINALKDFLEKNYGGLDVLVNNAAIAFKAKATETFDVQAEVTIATNYTATVDVCNALFPLLRPHARVSHVGSFVSAMTERKCSDALKKKFQEPLNVEQVNALMDEFVKSAKDGSFKQKGWAESAYGTSKVGIYLLTKAQQREFDKDPSKDIIVNCCCPGSVKTDMSSQNGRSNPDEGADCPTYAALLPANNGEVPKGQFLSKRKVYEWPGTIAQGDFFD